MRKTSNGFALFSLRVEQDSVPPPLKAIRNSHFGFNTYHICNALNWNGGWPGHGNRSSSSHTFVDSFCRKRNVVTISAGNMEMEMAPAPADKRGSIFLVSPELFCYEQRYMKFRIRLDVFCLTQHLVVLHREPPFDPCSGVSAAVHDTHELHFWVQMKIPTSHRKVRTHQCRTLAIHMGLDYVTMGREQHWRLVRVRTSNSERKKTHYNIHWKGADNRRV